MSTGHKKTRKGAVEAWNRIIALTQRVVREADTTLAGEAVNASQYALLAIVNRVGPVPQNRLAEALGTTEANISQLIAKMENADLVSRDHVGTAKPVQLTPEGQAILERLSPSHDRYISQQFDSLTDKQLEMLNELLEQLTSQTFGT